MEWHFGPSFVVFSCLFLSRNIVELILKPRMKKPATAENRGKLSLVLLSVPFLVSGVAVAVSLATRDANAVLYPIGALLLVLGFLGRVVSLRSLGRSYSLYIEPNAESELVTTGVYSVIRHPIYAFYMLETVALLFIQSNSVSWLCTLLVGAATLSRVNAEEAQLVGRYGDSARGYQKRTKKLIPGIY